MVRYDILQAAGFDVDGAVASLGGMEELYEETLASFLNDAEARLPNFSSVPAEDGLHEFAVLAHALKGMSAYVGATGLSDEARELEMLGKAGDRAGVAEKLPAFREHLAAVVATVRDACTEPAFS